MALHVPPAEAARRIRAALGYAGFNRSYKDVAKATGIPAARFRRITSHTKPDGATVDELWEIARFCGIPEAFMLEGFSALLNSNNHERAQERALAGLRRADEGDPNPRQHPHERPADDDADAG